MRKIFICIVCLVSVNYLSYGQNSYELTILEDFYEPLEQATLIDIESYDYENGWDNPEFSVPLGFTFSFLGNDIESLQQIGEGSLMAGVPSSGVQLFNGLMPVGFDLADRGLAGQEPSLIRYQTTGTPGERVFTIEWLNAGIYDEIFESDSLPVSSLNFQIWLYENDNSFEFRYGSMMYPVFDNPAIAAIFLDYNFSSNQGNILTLSGHPAFCELETINSADDLGVYSLSFFVNSMIYRFEPTSIPIEVNETNLLTHSTYPNPASNILTVDLGTLKDVRNTIKLYDSAGKVVFEKQSTTATLKIDVSGFAKGGYSLELSNNEQVSRSKVMIER
jgi:hypothetical protein